MVFTRRVFVPEPPDLVGKSWEEVARQLEDYLRDQRQIQQQSVPAGFKNLAPATLDPNAAAAAGAEADSWASASHIHALNLLLTTKGDLLTRDASAYVREAVGADGTFAIADSTATTGRRYISQPPSAIIAIMGL